MIDERREAQAAEYVVGALPPEELGEFEQALRSNLELQLFVRELRSSVEMLPFALPAVTPPVSLKEKIFARIAGAAAMPAAAPEGERAVFPLWLPWALAACLAVLCIVLVGFGSASRRQTTELNQKLEEIRLAQADLQRENEALQARVAAAATTTSNETARIAALEKQLAQKTQEAHKQKTEADKKAEEAQAAIIRTQRQLNFVQSQLAQAARDLNRARGLPDATTLNQGNQLDNLRVGLLKPTTDGPASAAATSVWEIHEQKGLLLVENLPPLGPDRDYQLWLFDPKFASPVSGGVFAVSETGAARLEFRAALPVETADRFAISIERKGGVTGAPEGKVVMLSN